MPLSLYVPPSLSVLYVCFVIDMNDVCKDLPRHPVSLLESPSFVNSVTICLSNHYENYYGHLRDEKVIIIIIFCL